MGPGKLDGTPLGPIDCSTHISCCSISWIFCCRWCWSLSLSSTSTVSKIFIRTGSVIKSLKSLASLKDGSKLGIALSLVADLAVSVGLVRVVFCITLDAELVLSVVLRVARLPGLAAGLEVGWVEVSTLARPMLLFRLLVGRLSTTIF